MTTYEFFIITEEQRDILMTFNSPEASINPRFIDATNPGLAINLNPHAIDFVEGDSVTLIGKYVAPKRIIDDPDYQKCVPHMITYLLGIPYSFLEIENIFSLIPE